MWHELLVALALVLVIEGIMPFASPARMRRLLLMVSQVSDTELRFMGLTSMVLGVVLLYVLRWGS